ncbi:hypothetical protein [Rhizobium giardinii]|uniref:hypothetical protein n=1 Tax=Rhizobium giardinii TaxID=56731 RepID=UPI003D6E0DE4
MRQWLNGVDVAALILAENVERRNLSAGQRAMARAMLKPIGEQGKRTDLDPTSFGEKEVSAASLSKTRFLLRHDEEMARHERASSLNASMQGR